MGGREVGFPVRRSWILNCKLIAQLQTFEPDVAHFVMIDNARHLSLLVLTVLTATAFLVSYSEITQQ